MPKTLFQNIVFTLMMSFLMVYAMICYNISLNTGGNEGARRSAFPLQHLSVLDTARLQCRSTPLASIYGDHLY